MSTEYIRDNRGKMLATIHTTAIQSYVTKFAGKTVATYRNGRTQDIGKNQSVKGNQLLRFVR